jgi:site-specific DNA recombinase
VRVARFAFYGRVSTEDQQDPKSSKDWQMARATALIEPVGGEIVAEFFDIGLSRSLPWKRRPQAAALLQTFANTDRGFSAVVVGEPARAFSGNQFGLTFPVFVHYAVQLWVPEVGGQVDPGSDAHDLVMSLYGGMSKGERNRTKIRVRAAMAAQAALDGRFLGGRPPYGYRLADLGAHPNPGKAAVGQRLHQLEPDPVTAPIVERIFAEYLGGRGFYAIGEGLTSDHVPCPSAYDRARNPHRSGLAWSKSAIRAILLNPRYTGHQVWNKQRKDEVLIDVEDVAQGHETVMRWNSESDWIWSPHIVHTPLINIETYQQVRLITATGQRQVSVRKPRATPRPYALRSLVFCGICDRRMQGTWNNGRAHYRCAVSGDHVQVARTDHPKAVYVREDHILGPLDGWLAQIFDPEHLAATVEALEAASEDPGVEARRNAAREVIRHCNDRLAKYRAALDAGVDPAVVGPWITEVQGERLRAEVAMQRVKSSDRMSKPQITSLIAQLGDIMATLKRADPVDKAEVYAQLGLRLTYDPQRRIVSAETSPAGLCTKGRVRGGT